MYLRNLMALCLTISLTAMVSGLQQKGPEVSSDVTFQNGVHIRIIPGDKGPADVNRYLAVRSPDLVYRLFLDPQGRLLFGYDITTSQGSHPGEVTINIKPLDRDALSLVHATDSNTPGEKSQLPTLDKELDISAAVGKAVVVNTFTEPATGIAVTDLIQVASFANAPSTEQTRTDLPSSDIPSIFKLANLRVWLNGKEITGTKPLHSVSGTYPVLYIPGHGSFFIALQPVANLSFVQAGSIKGPTIEFTSGSDHIVCKSSAPILADGRQTLMWIWHEPNYKLSIPQFDAFVGRPSQDKIQIAVADSMDVWRGVVSAARGSF